MRATRAADLANQLCVERVQPVHRLELCCVQRAADGATPQQSERVILCPPLRAGDRRERPHPLEHPQANDDVDPVARNLADGLNFRVRRNGAVAYRLDDGCDAFIDLGRRIDVLATGDDMSIATALRLAAEKYGGTFELTGSEEFKRCVIGLVVAHRIDDVRLRDERGETGRS